MRNEWSRRNVGGETELDYFYKIRFIKVVIMSMIYAVCMEFKNFAIENKDRGIYTWSTKSALFPLSADSRYEPDIRFQGLQQNLSTPLNNDPSSLFNKQKSLRNHV